jgi:hypothetical protein
MKRKFCGRKDKRKEMFWKLVRDRLLDNENTAEPTLEINGIKWQPAECLATHAYGGKLKFVCVFVAGAMRHSKTPDGTCSCASLSCSRTLTASASLDESVSIRELIERHIDGAIAGIRERFNEMTESFHFP